MLVIRLQRTGRKNSPAYRIVVAEKARPAKGSYHEIVGHYLPAREPVELTFDQDRIAHWMSQGACPSDTVARLLTKNGMKGLEKFIERYTKRRSKNAPAEEPPAPPAAPKPAAEAPKTEETPKPEAEDATKPEEAADTAAKTENPVETPVEAEKTENEGDTEAKAS